MICDIENNLPTSDEMKEIMNSRCINCGFLLEDYKEEIRFVRTGDTHQFLWWHASKGTHCEI